MEFLATWRTLKPSASSEQFSTASRPATTRSSKSTALINITRPYCDAAAARIADMLLPNDDRCWGIESTPIPDLIEEASEDVYVMLDPATNLMVTEKEFMDVIKEVAEARAKRGEKRIEDWLAEGLWKPEARAAIEDAARLGTGILKGPIPKRIRSVVWTFPNGVPVKTIKTEHVPITSRVDAWNFFPDPACGEDIQDGNHCFERDSITVRRLLELRETDGYIADQIDACIKEGPVGPEQDWTPSMQIDRTANTNKAKWEIWYYYGLVERADLEAAGYGQNGEIPEDGNYFHAIVTMVNHRVIRASLQALDDGTLPFDVMVWQKRPGMWCGMGIARQMRTPQRMLTAGVRNMMDNAALSAGPQVVIDTTKVEPVDGVWEIVPRKLWRAVSKAGEGFDTTKAFTIVSIETRQPELMNIIEFALRMAEESTGMPMILQGQLGEKKIETLGQQQMLQNNASAVLRRLAKLWDDDITAPHITRYYQYLMEYGENDKEKGDFKVVARGSSTLVERDIQNQGIALILDYAVKVPATELSPKKSAEEYVRSQHLDPKRFFLDDKEKAELANAPAAPDPKVEAAQITAESKAADREANAIQAAQDRDARMTEKLIDVNHETELFNAEQSLARETGSGI